MKKDKRPQMTSAMQRSWRPGGPSRIAYDNRMQNKKTSPETYRTPITVAEMKKAIGEPKTEMACEYYQAACQLLLAGNPDFRKPAEHLIAEADAILGIER